MTMDTVPRLLAEAAAQLAGAGELEVDLSGVTEADSAAVALLLDWVRATGARGRTLRVRGAPESVVNLARLYGVDEFLGLQ